MSDSKLSFLRIFKKEKYFTFGVFLLLCALILSFISISTEIAYYEEDGILDENRRTYFHHEIDSKMNILLKFESSEENEYVTAEIDNNDFETMREIQLNPSENKFLEMEESFWLYNPKENLIGDFYYHFEMRYPYHPYGVLAVPAIFLTFIGVILVYSGFKKYLRKVPG